MVRLTVNTDEVLRPGREFLKPRVPPPVLALLAAGLMWVLCRWIPLVRWMYQPWNWLGPLAVAMGFAMALAALMRFRQAHTTVNPLDPSRATHLVTEGVFAISRNPMYLALLLVLVGWGIWLQVASPWLVVVLFVVVITRIQIIPEEQALERLFGTEYTAYRGTVRRWIGRRG